jgi:hypothetical protein
LETLKGRDVWENLEDNIKMELKENGSKGVAWKLLAQDWNQWRVVVNTVMNRLLL